MIIAFDAKETEALKALAKDKGMSEVAVARQALRLYQLVHERLKAGETFSFSGDGERAREFAGVAKGECYQCRGTGRHQGAFGGPNWPKCGYCDGSGRET